MIVNECNISFFAGYLRMRFPLFLLFLSFLRSPTVAAQEQDERCFCKKRPGEYYCELQGIVIAMDDDTLFTVTDVLDLKVRHYQNYDPETMEDRQYSGAYIGDLQIKKVDSTYKIKEIVGQLYLHAQSLLGEYGNPYYSTLWPFDSLAVEQRFYTDATHILVTTLNADSLSRLRAQYRVLILPVTTEWQRYEKWAELQEAISKKDYTRALELNEEFFGSNLWGSPPEEFYHFSFYLKQWLQYQQRKIDYGNYQQQYAQLPPKELGEKTIGSLTWSKNSLGVTTFANGDPITKARGYSEACSLSKQGSPAYYVDENGYYEYNLAAIMDPRGVAPPGWHIATPEEWETLVHTPDHTPANLSKWILDSREGKNLSFLFTIYDPLRFYPVYGEQMWEKEEFPKYFPERGAELTWESDGSFFIDNNDYRSGMVYRLFVVKNDH